MTRLNKRQTRVVERRLAKGESLRAIAKDMGVTYQTLQYHRRRAGAAPLRPARTSGENHASWRGGSFVDRYGYRMVLAPERGKASKYAHEHVLLAERQRGAQLESNEVVHHLDLDPTNNAIDNLLVCTRTRHKQLHYQLERIAGELLRRGHVEWNGKEYRLIEASL